MTRFLGHSDLSGRVRAPASKSMAQRAIAAALLARGDSELAISSYCDDTERSLGAAVSLGARAERAGDRLRITGGLEDSPAEIDCGEAGLCVRMFTPIAALVPAEVRLSGRGTLADRFLGALPEAVRAFGAECSAEGGHVPVRTRGPMRGGKAAVDASLSSQFLTGLLMALPCARGDSELEIRKLTSAPYIRMTLELLRDFGIEVEASPALDRFRIRGGQGYKARSYGVEGDWSGAAFLLVAGAIASEKGIVVESLRLDSEQADRAILEALDRAGVPAMEAGGALVAKKGSPRSFEFDATDCPDLFPPLVSLAACCPGLSTLRGASRLAHKESDRAGVLVKEFGKVGVKVEVAGDLMTIRGGAIPGPMEGVILDSHGDHRIPMALSVAALAAEKTFAISGSECVAKSFPEFFEVIAGLGANVKEGGT